MRNLYVVLICIFCCTSCSKTNTPPDTPPNNNPVFRGEPRLSNPTPLDTLNDWVVIGRVSYQVEDIWFTSVDNGFMTNDSNIYVTHDRGNTWVLIPNTNVYLHTINLQFIDGQNGFAQGYTSLAITQNGGSTWVFKKLPASTALYSQFVSQTTGFFEEPDHGIQKTQDAGDHWAPITDTAQRNYPFYFLNSLSGFSFYKGNCSKTIDGGLTWTVKKTGVTRYGSGYFKMQFLDSLHGYAGTADGLLKTNDGGVNWVKSLPLTSHFMIPRFLDVNNGYCEDAGAIYKTTDGGQTWKVSCQLTDDSFSGLTVLDMNTAWASTFAGYVLRLK